MCQTRGISMHVYIGGLPAPELCNSGGTGSRDPPERRKVGSVLRSGRAMGAQIKTRAIKGYSVVHRMEGKTGEWEEHDMH